VFGVAHLKKATTGDVVAGINASSAFGEVARAVFGFAKDPASDGDRIMSQAKNSTGEEDLSVTYRIESETVTTDSGKSAEVGRFVITGDSDRTVSDVLRDADPAPVSEAQIWLEDYLSEHQPAPSKAVKDEGRGEGFSASAIERAARRIGVVTKSEGFPRRTYWSLPQSRQRPPQDSRSDVTDVTDATDSYLHEYVDATRDDPPVASVTSVASPPCEDDATGKTCPRCGTNPIGWNDKCGVCVADRIAAQGRRETA